ncbi:hypothetical protein OPT61_g6689 [Boeremia exigua]|uniref:Uncharacterized protein n=1 Tax=Boeremia exigua TaxID=749465 RepID=A0ACC2I5Q4_9PLEO|nr:hypothetical protein OPT61_g6689 [Boeremia exigua]
MAYLLGWKDILRPIRDGYRHLFPPPDTGPTPEERRKQRAIDQLKGFTYFDTFEQLEAWTDADAHLLQQANTPLLVRSVNKEEIAKTKVLLCHDYAGNYYSYEGASNEGVAEEKYACEYLQHVDTFIYFSHKLVCVPPPSWTNTLHRNGVVALGTILIEPQTPESGKLLQRGDDGLSFPLATKLALIAGRYGFDGWLVNIEKSFPTDNWDPQFLVAFLCQLRSELGPRKQVVWYDALTALNKVSYQNALNAQNSLFAKACGSVLVNYCWKEEDAADSIHEALQRDLSPQDVYFGIDVWAQNVTKFSQPRVTYPEYGGGGTNTGVAVAKLAELGLSSGVFAPAWTFEHFPGHGRGLEQTMWEGLALPKDLACSCGDCDKRHRPNKAMPITSFAKLSSAGSETFFFTDFSRAFGTHNNEEKDSLFSGYDLHSQLGSQSVLPLKTESLRIACPVRHRVEDVKGRSQLVIETCSLPSSLIEKKAVSPHHGWSIPLFRLDMPADGSLQLRISYRDLSPGPHGISFYLKISGTMCSFVQSDYSQVDHLLDINIGTSIPESQTLPRLEELGFYLQSVNTGIGTRLAEVDYVCIQPVASCPAPHKPVPHGGRTFQSISSQDLSSENLCTIFDIRLMSLGEGDAVCTKLCWNHSFDGQPARGLPYSTITGPFSYFVIDLDHMVLGRAYVAEQIIPASFVEQSEGREVFVKIKGIGFDGQELATAAKTVRF